MNVYQGIVYGRYKQNQRFIQAVKQWFPAADLQWRPLPGGHCAGSTQRGEDGEYAFVKEVLGWLQ